MNNSELLELVIASLPYPDQITNIDFTSSDIAIRFSWRGDKFRVSNNKMVEQVERGCLAGSNLAIVLEHLINKTDVLRN